MSRICRLAWSKSALDHVGVYLQILAETPGLQVYGGKILEQVGADITVKRTDNHIEFLQADILVAFPDQSVQDDGDQ